MQNLHNQQIHSFSSFFLYDWLSNTIKDSFSSYFLIHSLATIRFTSMIHCPYSELNFYSLPFVFKFFSLSILSIEFYAQIWWIRFSDIEMFNSKNCHKIVWVWLIFVLRWKQKRAKLFSIWNESSEQEKWAALFIMKGNDKQNKYHAIITAAWYTRHEGTKRIQIVDNIE